MALKNAKQKQPHMKTKLALFAAVILVGISSTAAIAGLDTATPAAPVADKPAGMNCCSKGQKAPGQSADQEVPATSGMSCHPGANVAKEVAPVKPKGCCK